MKLLRDTIALFSLMGKLELEKLIQWKGKEEKKRFSDVLFRVVEV